MALSDNEIIKALEELLKELKSKKQLIVPEQGVKNLCYGLQNFLDLINRQKADIERLCIEIDELIIAKDLLFDEAEALIKKAKAEAIKEFAERLKEKASRGFWETDDYVGTEQIDDLVEEMVGDNDAET